MNYETRTTDDVQIPVLIVGGALVGLSMSLFLAWQGVSSLLVEKHPQPARLPRTRGYNARTMELFRIFGLEETIRAAQSPRMPSTWPGSWPWFFQGKQVLAFSIPMRMNGFPSAILPSNKRSFVTSTG